MMRIHSDFLGSVQVPRGIESRVPPSRPQIREHFGHGYESWCGIELAVERLFKLLTLVESVIKHPRLVMILLQRIVIFVVTCQVVILIMMALYSYQNSEEAHVNGSQTPAFDTSWDLRPSHSPTELPGDSELLPAIYSLATDETPYFRTLNGTGQSCFIAGTDWTISRTICRCLDGYHGDDCGIPSPVWLSCRGGPCSVKDLKARHRPRRIIHGININHEKDFLEIRLEEIGDVVDVVIVAESNLTAGGDPKPLYILPALRAGFMRRFQKKMIHVFLDHFPAQGYTDGWFADTYIRDEMGRRGLSRIRGIRDDDLFVLLDADEIPDRRVLLFLKLYDGYPEPIAFTMRWSIYGFFWRKVVAGTDMEEFTSVVAAATMAMIRDVYDNQVMSMRRNRLEQSPLFERVANYSKSHRVDEWNIGRNHPAGFHCSWCYPPEGIRLKLLSAQKDDKPRWGDYPEKLDLNYIRSLIRDGLWFDGTRPVKLVEEPTQPYAPGYVLKNERRFTHLLKRPGQTESIVRTLVSLFR